MTVHLCVDPPEMILLHLLSVICIMKTIRDFSQIRRKITIMLNMCFSYYIPSAVLTPTSPNRHPLSSPWKFYFLFIIILSPSFSLFFPFFIFFLIYLQKKITHTHTHFSSIVHIHGYGNSQPLPHFSSSVNGTYIYSVAQAKT